MYLLDDASLEHSTVVANSLMNRERGAVGVNSYEKEVFLNPLRFLTDRLDVAGSASWLDLCCGRGRALIEAAEIFDDSRPTHRVRLHGVDLVDFFDEAPQDAVSLNLVSASLHQWEAAGRYDLITCVHGLHYVGDKLSLIERAAGWLNIKGMFLANLDLTNLRQADGRPLVRRIAGRFRECSLVYDNRRRILSCVGATSLSLGYRYIGADDKAGPNYTGQEAVDSYYEQRDPGEMVGAGENPRL